jgi:hypothetical protein
LGYLGGRDYSFVMVMRGKNLVSGNLVPVPEWWIISGSRNGRELSEEGGSKRRGERERKGKGRKGGREEGRKEAKHRHVSAAGTVRA